MVAANALVGSIQSSNMTANKQLNKRLATFFFIADYVTSSHISDVN